MSALTETGAIVTELGGVKRVASALFDGQAGSAGTWTIDEASTIHSVVACLAEAPTADCAGVAVRSIASNVVTFQLIEGDGTINTQNPLDFYAIAIIS